MSDEVPPVGSLAEEADKLLRAVRDWLGDEVPARGAPTAQRFLRQVDEHIATGSAECSYCPLCQLIAVVRESPVFRQHMSGALESLVKAVGVLLAASKAEDPARAGGGSVERIDLSDDWMDD